MDTKWRTPNIRFTVGLEHVDDLLEEVIENKQTTPDLKSGTER